MRLCPWMLLPPGTLPEGESWTAPWAGSQEQSGGSGVEGTPCSSTHPPLLFCRVFKKASPNGKVRGTWRGEPWGHKHGWEWGMDMSLSPVWLSILPGWQEGKRRHSGAGGWLFQGQGSGRLVLECWGAGDSACGGFGLGSRS